MTTETSVAEGRLGSITYTVLSDPGRRREENQDSFGVIEGASLRVYMVADGMGGARGGAVASGLAIDLIKTALRGQNNLSVSDIVNSVQQANKAIGEKGALDAVLSGMGTTLVGIAFSAEKTFVFNVGDSRLYRLRKNGIEVCTEDHTLVQELLKSGAIGPDQARNHPVSHMLTRSLGPSSELKVDCYEIMDGPFASERYLLCSDGLYNQVSMAEMDELLRKFPKQEAARELIELANSRGGPDNITALIVEIGDSFPQDLSLPSTSPASEISDADNGKNDLSASNSDRPGILENRISEQKIVSAGGKENNNDLSSADSVLNKKRFSIFSNRLIMLLATFLSMIIVVLLGLIDSDNMQMTPPAVNNASVSVTPRQTAIAVTATAPASPVAKHSATAVTESTKSVPVATIAIQSAADLLKSGEQALLARQTALQLRLAELNIQFVFFSESEESRNKRLQELNDQKVTLSAQISELTSTSENVNSDAQKLKSIAASAPQADPLTTARNLAGRLPKVAELQAGFEKATQEYLEVLQEIRSLPESAELKAKLADKLKNRTTAFEALKLSLENSLSSEIAAIELQQKKLSSDLLAAQSALAGNDQLRIRLGEIAALRQQSEIDRMKQAIQQEMADVESELTSLKG